MKLTFLSLLSLVYTTICYCQDFNIMNNDISISISISKFDTNANLKLRFFNLTQDTLLLENFSNNNVILNLGGEAIEKNSEGSKILYIYCVPLSDVFVSRLRLLCPKDSLYFEQKIDSSKFAKFNKLWFELDYFNLNSIIGKLGSNLSPFYIIKHEEEEEILSIDRISYLRYYRKLYFESDLRIR